MDKRKKILYIITKSNFGGAQRYIYDLTTGLPKDKYEAVVASGGNGLLKEKLEKAGMRALSIEHMGRNISFIDDLLSFIEILSIVKKEKPDVVHLNSPKAGGLGALASRIAGVRRIVYTAHGWTFREERPMWQNTLIYLFSWITVALCHETINVSEKDYNDCPKFLVGKKIKTIHNGINLPKEILKSTARKKLLSAASLPTNQKRIYLGTIAELHKNKGLKYLVEAISQLKDENKNICCFIIGEGEERNNLERQVEKNGLHEQVKLLGFVDNASEILPAFDIFVLPSVKEGLTYTLLEAGAIGLPTIATSTGGVPEIIEDMKTGILVRPKQPVEIASAIRFILSDKKRASEMGSALSEKIRGEFSLERMIKETIACY